MAKSQKVKAEETPIVLVPEVKEGEHFDLREVAKETEVAAEKQAEPPAPPKPTYRKELDAALPFEERIIAFLEGRSEAARINDFLKSLYPLPKMNEIPVWSTQAASKSLKGLLSKMQEDGKINIINGAHKKLGAPYYVGNDQKQAHHNLNSVLIQVQM